MGKALVGPHAAFAFRRTIALICGHVCLSDMKMRDRERQEQTIRRNYSSTSDERYQDGTKKEEESEGSNS